MRNLISQIVSILLIFLVLINEVKYYLNQNSLASNILTLDLKQKVRIIESVDEKIKSMTYRRFENEIREKEETIHAKVFGALYERRIGEVVLNLHFSYSIAT